MLDSTQNMSSFSYYAIDVQPKAIFDVVAIISFTKDYFTRWKLLENDNNN